MIMARRHVVLQRELEAMADAFVGSEALGQERGADEA